MTNRQQFSKITLEKTEKGIFKSPEKRGHINSLQMGLLYNEEKLWLKNKNFKTIASLVHACMRLEQKLSEKPVKKGKAND